MTFERDRQFYRTKIRPGDVAVFLVDGLRMPIREISERGIRYVATTGHAPRIGEQVKGTVVLETIGDIDVTGTFTRIQDEDLVLLLDPPGILHATITTLQQLLMKRYAGPK